ncbi:MAG: FAD-dependent oxidoreductase, partial [Gemmatimonadaceae bacterium]
MTDSYDYDLVCIGSGPAGQRGAVQAAKLGRRVAIVERRTTLGGICVATGTIPSKTFREAVVSLTNPGLTATMGKPAIRPTAQQLLARVDELVGREGSVIGNQLSRNGVDVFCGDASFVDPHRIRISAFDGWREITTANALIACGTRAMPPSGVASDGEAIITSDDIGQLKRLPKSLAVIGAGVIGIEYASMFAALGVEVTVVDKRDRPLEFIDAEIVDELIHQMRKRNVSFR